jgi:hypothetical protein
MKRILFIVCIFALLGILPSVDSIAQDNQKLAQTSFKFLSVISDARAASMANAMTSLQISSGALFANPAGMSGMKNSFDISASKNQWIADINHYTVGGAVRLLNGDYGVIGFSLQYVDYGKFIETRVSSNPLNLKGYDDIGIFKLYALALGVGYAKEISDQFSVGGQIRWAHQDLGNSYVPNDFPTQAIYDPTDTTHKRILGYADSARSASNKLTPLVFDFGTQFKTGIKSLVFGMSLRNFSKEIQYVYEQFQLPLVFTIGISMNLMDIIGEVPLDQSLLMSVDASHYRDHPEQLKIGLEYSILKMLSLRGGFASNSDDDGWSFGVGFSQSGLGIDYAYTPFGVFNKVQRFTIRFSH